MGFDFERDYGVNAGYVEGLFEEWQRDPESVEESWRRLFERVDQKQRSSESTAPEPASAAAAAPQAPVDEELELLSGVSGRIVANMVQSLDMPTATSVRQIGAKLLDENRRILNEHMKVRALGKASYTHLIAFALVRALAEMPRVQSAFEERDGKPYRRVHEQVNLGLAIDVPGPKGRMLVVPNIKAAEGMSFQAFHAAYEDLVRRGRDGKLTMEDYRGTTTTLTNPGGFGTSMSVPRLMQGQGLIIATGSIGVSPELAGMSAVAKADLALGPVLAITSTYDHRVVQGAESGLFLRRVDELLQGADGFYAEVFASMRVPWAPHEPEIDQRAANGADYAEVQAKVWQLVNAYRARGGYLADLDPLEYHPNRSASLDPSSYGLTVWDLDRSFLCGGMGGKREMTLREILFTLRRAYCRRWTVEAQHIADRRQKLWIRDRVEDADQEFIFDQEHRMRILGLLSRAENFERFLHTAYVGNKRFSLEGADTLIPAIAEAIDQAAETGVERVVVGMAHRGRLNVLANIMGKSYADIFSEFEGVLLPLSSEGTGDVKYHKGQRGTYKTPSGQEVEVVLSANPSHLEAVDPVVCGMTRAYQDIEGDADRKKTLAILVHGDAAFSGQGVVAETLNMSQLRAYSSGGTLHIVVNNQIGFTASPRDLRSTYYCTDVAKGVQAPIFHANGDFPESVLRATRMAVGFQREFGRDSVVDLVCYRRWGHNEGDEPAYTQPTLYSKIRTHPTVRENYTRLLIRREALTREDAQEIGERYEQELQAALDEMRARPQIEHPVEKIIDLHDDDPGDYVVEPSPETGVDQSVLVEYIDELNAMPEGHVPHPKLLRQLRRREQMARGEMGVDWGCAEALMFATLVHQGVSIRLAGQDSGRGTFSTRHAVIRDQVTGAEYVPLVDLCKDCASFEAWDSLLSEEAALGFEYGYALANPKHLVLWEAQFGDFANGAQIQIDQFLAAGEAKWGQRGGVTLLLPHGYDGQGPEHSSARVERFLTLCSGGNMTVANCSTSAQYFHLLRRQGLASQKRPLIVFTPKSMLRDRRAASDVGELATGAFQEVIADGHVPEKGARRVVFSTGKIYHELSNFREEQGVSDVALVRVEQLYPFPKGAIEAELARYDGAEVVWAQEEPRNMGAWSFMLQRFMDMGTAVKYSGRPESASPSTGSYRRHLAEHQHVLERTFA